MHQYHAAKIISSSVENDYTEKKHINERIIVQFIITLLLVILLVPDISKAHPSVVKCIF